MPSVTALRDRPHRIAPPLVPGLDLFAGRFDAACAVCGGRPCTLLLRDHAPNEEPAALAQYFYCRAHEPAADRQYEALAA